MRFYAAMDSKTPLSEVPGFARRVEAMGFDRLKVAETIHDSFMSSLLAVEHTERLEVITGITLAFPRSPMVVAYAAWDLQRLSGGRFALGLGTQVKGNIEGRFSVEWKAPVERMREYVGSLRAIWGAFQSGEGLSFEGDHYRFTRLQPYFNPGPIEDPGIPVFLGAVNPRLCRMAAEVADGLLTHKTNSSPRYLREVTIPNVRVGLERSGRDESAFEVVIHNHVITGITEEDVARNREVRRRSMAFLYSTPPYWASLDLFGWGEVGRRLRELSLEGRWDDMAGLVTDEMLDAFVPQATYEALPEILAGWFGPGAAITFPVPEDPQEDEHVAQMIERLRPLAP